MSLLAFISVKQCRVILTSSSIDLCKELLKDFIIDLTHGLAELGQSDLVLRSQTSEHPCTDLVDQWQHSCRDYWLDNELKDVLDELVALPTHRLLQLIKLGGLPIDLRLRRRHLANPIQRYPLPLPLLLLDLIKQLSALGELHLAEQIGNPRRVHLPKDGLDQLLRQVAPIDDLLLHGEAF